MPMLTIDVPAEVAEALGGYGPLEPDASATLAILRHEVVWVGISVCRQAEEAEDLDRDTLTALAERLRTLAGAIGEIERRPYTVGPGPHRVMAETLNGGGPN